MKPPLAQHQANKRKERYEITVKRRIKDFEMACLSKYAESQNTSMVTISNAQPDVKPLDWRNWF
jgi:hypothetical protein